MNNTQKRLISIMLALMLVVIAAMVILKMMTPGSDAVDADTYDSNVSAVEENASSASAGEGDGTREAAIDAYKKLLSEPTFWWWEESEGVEISSDDCDFGLIYVDDDDVPELVVYQHSILLSHAAGYAALYTYCNGEVVVLNEYPFDDCDYYAKTGIYVAVYRGMGGEDTYYRLAEEDSERLYEVEPVNPLDFQTTTYYDCAKDTEIGESEFASALNELVGSTERNATVSYENTQENRDKYLT